jgi:hypothetical protein
VIGQPPVTPIYYSLAFGSWESTNCVITGPIFFLVFSWDLFSISFHCTFGSHEIGNFLPLSCDQDNAWKMNYKKLHETRRPLKFHKDTIDKHYSLIQSIKEKMVDKENITSS